MRQDQLNCLEEALAREHAEVLSSLRPGGSRSYIFHRSLAVWFSWRDGQSPDAPLFHERYSFVGYGEARAHFRSSVGGAFPHLFATLLFARHVLYSIPLLIDGAGEGYFYSYLSGTVVYRFEGESARSFCSFSQFVDYLIELAKIPASSGNAGIERELELLEEYAR